MVNSQWSMVNGEWGQVDFLATSIFKRRLKATLRLPQVKKDWAGSISPLKNKKSTITKQAAANEKTDPVFVLDKMNKATKVMGH